MVFFVIVWMLAAFSYINLSFCCPEQHLQALLEFKSLVKSSLPAIESWNTSNPDCCEWDRVACNGFPSDTRSITALRFSYLFDDFQTAADSGRGGLNVLNSIVLVPLFRISSLTILDVSSNFIGGEIPESISNLTELRVLDLTKNSLTGGIPASLQKLDKLEKLRLGNNLLSGDIPMWLFDMKDLRVLELGGNNFTWNNNANEAVVVAPKSMSITKLDLRSCRLSGPIPNWISTQKDLCFLDLSKNQLEGTLPSWLVDSHFLSIVLSDNQLTGSLSPGLFDYTSLSVLDLSSNNFSGELPQNIGHATSAMIIALANNSFTGSVPESIAMMHNLIFLDLSGNQLSGNRFPSFNQDSKLAFIDVSRNKLSGDIPVNFGIRTKKLALGNNEFSGKLPLNLSNLNQLKHLDLQNNRITGEIPQSLSHISTLEILILRNNSLDGPIPESLSSLTNLHILDLSSNRLIGKLPPKLLENSLSNMTGTQHLTVDEYVIPVSYLDLADLEFTLKFNDLLVIWKRATQGLSIRNLKIYSLLDLSRNKLSGEIPDSFGSLMGLKVLNISHNNISGKIPQSFGDLKSIESLDLSHNSLSGEIPQTLTKLHQIATLDLSNNKLVGQIPIGGQMNTWNDPIYFANNSGLCGKQIQVPCSVTPETSTEPGPSSRSDQTWFSWLAAGIGYPIGFFSAVGASYTSGYLVWKPKKRAKSNPRRA